MPPSILLEDSAPNSKKPTHNGIADCYPASKSQQPIVSTAANDRSGESHVPSVDASSLQGKFGWTKVNNIDIPFILRGKEHYVSVRMIEMKLLKAYFETLPMNLFTIARVNSEYVTANEAGLLNEINVKHCDCKFGKSVFSRYDLIVQEDAVKEMCGFLNNCHLMSIAAMDKTRAKCGLVSLDGMVVPFVMSENSQWVPMALVPTSSWSSCAIQMTVSKWQMGYLKFCCHLAKMDDSAINDTSKIVRVQDITSANGTNVKIREIDLTSFVKAPTNVQDVANSDGLRVNGSFNHQSPQQQSWMMSSAAASNIASPPIMPAHQRQSPVAPASKSINVPPYSPNSPLLAPSPQQLSPSVEPVGTPPYSHHMTLPHNTSNNHINTFNHHVPSISSLNNSTGGHCAIAHSSSRLLCDSLQSSYNNTNLPNGVPQESHCSTMPHISSERDDILRKRTHNPYVYNKSSESRSERATRSVNPEFISLPSSYVDIDEFSAPPKKSLPSSTARSLLGLQNFILIPDHLQIDERFPAYSVSQVRLESCMLPAVNTKPYSYNDALMVPLFYVSYKFFPDISLEVCQQALKQILGVNIFIANR